MYKICQTVNRTFVTLTSQLKKVHHISKLNSHSIVKINHKYYKGV